ncbi:YycH family regulatory protein [Salisediminibacterium halotolerans]|uniref:Two-component signal transduction system YycFG, regulatory protein YycH n=1 Tax=Salisediminibacterium halotolerans TaxID=517425 RepID=A0A1H9WL05_9BACI|nr:two-component system activity regulator YycH [Salisediminibacterium haloalkalitolerans]SES34596.1 Two-component signal transduction system YycFG, regulatory protein YycH [Salisediminibacterium haloalkalitolerans]
MIEMIKTGVLWVLIVSSIVMTWMLWSYQPDYRSTNEEPDESYVEIEDIGESRSLSAVIHPREVISHQGENIDYISSKDNLYETVLDELQDVEIDYLVQRGNHNAPALDRSIDNAIELIFDEAVPGEIMEEILTIEDNDLPLEQIDRLVAAENDSSVGAEVVLQFVDIEHEQIYEADTDISAGQLDDIRESGEGASASAEPRVFEEDPESEFQQVRYVLTEELTVNQYTYETTDLSPQAFRQVLFSDPDFVEEYHQTGNENAYTDGNRMMHILDDGMILSFSQTDVHNGIRAGDDHIIDDTRSFVNGHSGWTDTFYWDDFTEYDTEEHVSYRMHVDGIPVMSSNTNQSEYYMMEMERRGEDITEYTRPLYQLAEEPIDTETDRELAPFSEVETFIEENESFAVDEVQDIQIGHYMNRNRSFSAFEPSWFVLVRDRWMELEMHERDDSDDPEVTADGLE